MNTIRIFSILFVLQFFGSLAYCFEHATSSIAAVPYPMPEFSKDRGFYDQAFSLSLNDAFPDARIFYTLDGSEPSPTHGWLYQAPLSISKTTIVRAMATGAASDSLGLTNSGIVTYTYLFIEDVLKQNNKPIGYPEKWGKYDGLADSATADYEMDPEIVSIKANADKIRQSFGNLPIVSIVTDKDNLFSKLNDAKKGGIYIYTGSSIGDGWERPASFEYFDAKGSVSIQENCGIELHGSASRLPEKSPKHSFKVGFKTEFGASKLRYPLFGATQAQKINAFYLRAGFGYSWVHWDNNNRTKAIYSRDEWAKETQRKMGCLSGNTQHAHLFINGMYWGLYNPTEKIDDDYCETYLGGDKTEWDVVRVEELNTVWKNLCSMAVSGSDTVWMKIQGMNPDGTPNPEYPPLLNVENFIDYMILNFYGGNEDWDHHNWYAARNRVNPGKGFQFFCWDSESLLLNVTSNLLTKYNKNCPSDLFQSLRKNPVFCRMYGDRVQKHCFNGGALTPEVAAETFLELVTPIEDALYAESARWGDYRRDVHPYSSAGVLYKKEVQYDAQKKWMLETYFPQRTANFVSYMKAAGLYPSVAAPTFSVNGLVLSKDSIFEGDRLSMSASGGKIYYTTDDTDPVKWSKTGSGSTTSSAKYYTASLMPEQSCKIKARAVYNGVWSALVEQNLVVKLLNGMSERPYVQVAVSCSPNPMRDETRFRFDLPSEAFVRLTVTDLSGRIVGTVVDAMLNAGCHDVAFDGSKLKPGMYLYALEVDGEGKMETVGKIVKW